MQCVILANGEYGNLENYRDIFKEDNIVLCADGGANYAYKLGLMPELIIGDMDSILSEVKEFYEAQGVPFQIFSKRKDFTDTQLAMSMPRNGVRVKC
jgi:thiamine pyrophosphokinase